MRKTNIQTTIFLLFFLLAGQFSAISAYASEITPESVIFLVNQERKSEALEGLQRSEVLDRVAKAKAQDMLEKDYFAHTSPEGVSPWFWFEKEGYEYEYAGENLAINFLTAEKQNESWMKSTTHKKNILNPSFSEIGVAVKSGIVDGKNTNITVQVFGSRAYGAAIAGEDSRKTVQSPALEPVSAAKTFEKSSMNMESGFLAGVFSNLQTEYYLKIIKGSLAISALIMLVIFFSSFAHRLSRVGEKLSRIGNTFFHHENLHANKDEEEHKIIVKVFPVDMKKIEITHLSHMKQRE